MINNPSIFYKEVVVRLSLSMSKLARRSSIKGIAVNREGPKGTHPSIENPYQFPLPVPGAIIIEEEVVKEGHLVKNLKRRLFTLVIDSENFPCLIYACVCLYFFSLSSLSNHFFREPKSKTDTEQCDDNLQEKGHVRLVWQPFYRHFVC
jgi:hypothetical protein